MEKLKIGINIIMAFSFVIIAFSLFMIATNGIAQKGWSFRSGDYHGSYPTYKQCMEEELLYWRSKAPFMKIEVDDLTCEYR